MLGRGDIQVEADCAGHLFMGYELMKGLERSAFTGFDFHRDQGSVLCNDIVDFSSVPSLIKVLSSIVCN